MIQRSLTVGLIIPCGIIVYGVAGEESLIVADIDANQVVHMANVDSNNKTISLLAVTWIISDLYYPTYMFLDTQNASDLYVSDCRHDRVVLFSSMQINNPLPRIVAGITASSGPALNEINGTMGVTLDKQKNIYVADLGNHRIMLWTPNAIQGILIVGTGTFGSDSMSLNSPGGIFLDQDNSLLYVADILDHRIQVFQLNGTPPYNGSTVAGGNGAGSGSQQLNEPFDVWVSKTTGAIYIADQSNHRIQRWNKGATTGVTLAGDPNGTSGSSSTMLNNPIGLAINRDETRMYVSDGSNHRVQCFDLI